MIYTVTLNPSIDYVVGLTKLEPGKINRVGMEQIYVGGKGLNVSFVLKKLQRESVALGFLAGFTGDKIADFMSQADMKTDFIRLEQGFSRINVKVQSEEESEINGMGPVIEKRHIQSLYSKIEQIQSDDMLVLAGSVPRGVDADIYYEICRRMKKRGTRVVIDASGELLKKSLGAEPFLIKPNLVELEQVTGQKLQSREEIVQAARLLLDMGAENVLVSCGSEGAVLVQKKQVVWQKAVLGKVVNTVGSGDSLVAGFLDGWLQTANWKEALKEGVAAGSASALGKGLPEQRQIRKVYECMPMADELT